MTQFLTAKELAERLRVSVETIRSWARQGKLPCCRAAQRPLLFDPNEVDEVVRNRERRVGCKAAVEER